MLKRQFKNSKLRSERLSKSLRRGSYFNCIQCSKEFWRKPAEIKTGDCKFCSRQCYQTWQKGKPKLSGFKKDNPRWNGGITTENHINCEVVMSKEYWKSVLGYDNYYSVSNLGNIRRDKASGGTQAGRILHPSITNQGYPQVTLYISGKSKKYTIHTIVMKSFIGEISKGLIVNHKDGVKTNNNVENLEWCTHSYNMNYGTLQERKGKANGVPVYQYTKSGDFVKKYPSLESAAVSNGFQSSPIQNCCCGRSKTSYGFIWKY